MLSSLKKSGNTPWSATLAAAASNAPIAVGFTQAGSGDISAWSRKPRTDNSGV